jgi:hypothetical protein
MLWQAIDGIAKKAILARDARGRKNYSKVEDLLV